MAEHRQEFILAPVGLTQLLSETSSLGDVARDFRGADDLALAVPYRRNRDRDVDHCAVFPATTCFKVIDDLPSSDVFQNAGFLVDSVWRHQQTRYGLPHRLLCVV